MISKGYFFIRKIILYVNFKSNLTFARAKLQRQKKRGHFGYVLSFCLFIISIAGKIFYVSSLRTRSADMP